MAVPNLSLLAPGCSAARCAIPGGASCTGLVGTTREHHWAAQHLCMTIMHLICPCLAHGRGDLGVTSGMGDANTVSVIRANLSEYLMEREAHLPKQLRHVCEARQSVGTGIVWERHI